MTHHAVRVAVHAHRVAATLPDYTTLWNLLSDDEMEMMIRDGGICDIPRGIDHRADRIDRAIKRATMWNRMERGGRRFDAQAAA